MTCHSAKYWMRELTEGHNPDESCAVAVYIHVPAQQPWYRSDRESPAKEQLVAIDLVPVNR